MIFKEIKTGHDIYIMNRESMEISKGTVTNVTAPHMETKPNSPCQFVVDVTVSVNGKPTTYVTQDSASVCYCGNLVISCDKQGLLNDVKSSKSQCEQILASVPATKEKLDKCNKAISELDDAEREKQANEQRLHKLEINLEKLSDGMNKLLSKLSSSPL